MTAAKIAISLPPRTLALAKAAVKRKEAPSVSAYVAQAIEEKAERESLADLLDEILASTGGPMTASERARADRALSSREAPRSRRRAG